MGNKHPVSVLVVIFAQDTGRVLMLQRRDDASFWQSVTGSLEVGETPRQAAEREVSEELSINIADEKLVLEDCHKQIEFEIFPHYRHRYAPGITHNREHWFRLALPAERDLLLTEHLAARWLEPAAAAALTKSWSNRQAIEEFI
ncbi:MULTISPECIES: dihydroneopterin triphosphate diphosphatase [Pantoea]|uniref:Dihydroneopterin triphosphate diphosphatase n=2 Tax=Pantoea stewartii TaxID=66269 RepID=H3RFM1_PANSE|nr:MULTISPECIES: dihydroneopterin triphosphate diphosphatase [Pantoea]ARF50569.1 dihydroneopterin triphosphate diphosphatase [Pantoea stewartii subsp. stewartii DC283]EHU00064.1 dATP pyrophosphohydrolase [Pantoea stewartii subsp. stewartii DC283]KAB0559261.1 dihydroneopterin triphosphate diphosphatase [Pantoea stewartii subsp. stewartii]KGD81308.1 dihydroneopterin triphosphate pyrophosphatase [Pantoea stewartii subsp. indologenes]KTS27670.1 dihydroneopterin triphosphate pyrophosphatase [Pantoe